MLENLSREVKSRPLLLHENNTTRLSPVRFIKKSQHFCLGPTDGLLSLVQETIIHEIHRQFAVRHVL